MGTQYPDLFGALNREFDGREVKKRSQAGRQLSYITARTAMNRLDAVLGPENWWDEYLPGEHSVICKLTVRLPDGSTLTKSDAGGYAGMADEGDDDKSGFSDAFKRAAVKFGVGRYLYQDGVPNLDGGEAAPAPGNISTPDPAPRQDPPQGQQGDPRTGRALFAWAKSQEQQHDVVLIKPIDAWAKSQGFPYKMVDWDQDQVSAAVGEARRIMSGGPGPSPAPATPPAASPFIPDDRNPVARPKDGRELYQTLNRLQDEHNCTLIDDVLKWHKSADIRSKLVDLSGDDLTDTWRCAGTILARVQAKRAKTTDAARLRAECRDAARKYLATAHGGDAGVTDAMVRKEIEGLHVQEFDGEILTDWPGYQDVNRLRRMIDAFHSLAEDAANVPAGI